jgi:hypothetical protein
MKVNHRTQATCCVVAVLTYFVAHSAWAQLVITGVFDGPLPGGNPKGIELYAMEDIADLSLYGIGSANNGGGSDGQEFTFPNDAANRGEFIYIGTEQDEFDNFFGFPPRYLSSAVLINGNDAIELFHQGEVIDVFGEIDVDGTGQPWEYADGWAYRQEGTGPDRSDFVLSNWLLSGPDALDGEVANDLAATPIPIGSYQRANQIVPPVAGDIVPPRAGDIVPPQAGDIVPLEAGDADQDLDFDQLDLVKVQVAARYLTGQPATWGQGDWDGAPGGEAGSPPLGDGEFNQRDIIAALSAGTYLTGSYGSVRPPQRAGNEERPAEPTSGDWAPNRDGRFETDSPTGTFQTAVRGSLDSIHVAKAAQSIPSEASLRSDLSVASSLAPEATLGNADLVYVPEPASIGLLFVALAITLPVGWKLRRGSTSRYQPRCDSLV